MISIGGLIIVDNTHSSQGPGVVYDNSGKKSLNERAHFFDVPSEKFAQHHLNGLRANDTSTTVAYAPLSNMKKLAILLETSLNTLDFKSRHPYVGTDIKVMVVRTKKGVDVTMCVPMISAYVKDYEEYVRHLATTRTYIEKILEDNLPSVRYELYLNTRDNPQNADLYLTLLGSALESGDEGAIGRGNRHTGVIPFMRNMSIEACCGKNPVYHVGKIYTATGDLISKEIWDTLEIENQIFLTTQMGRQLNDPLMVAVDVGSSDIDIKQKQMIESIVLKHLDSISSVTDKIVSEKIKLY